MLYIHAHIYIYIHTYAYIYFSLPYLPYLTYLTYLIYLPYLPTLLTYFAHIPAYIHTYMHNIFVSARSAALSAGTPTRRPTGPRPRRPRRGETAGRGGGSVRGTLPVTTNLPTKNHPTKVA